MCRTLDFKHVCCGCIHHSINIIPCPSMDIPTQEFHGKIQPCCRQTTHTSLIYEGLPCCKKCYPGKKAWVQENFEEFEEMVARYEKTGLYTTAEITRALKGGVWVRDLLVGKLDTPQKESGWWDGGMDEVSFVLELGGKKYHVVWE